MPKKATVTKIESADELTTLNGGVFKSEKQDMGPLLGIKEKTAIHRKHGAKADGSDTYSVPLQLNVYEPIDSLSQYYFDKDTDYVFPTVNESDGSAISPVKLAAIALETGKTMFVFGGHGTGKTTLIEQMCAFTGRPAVRVQHVSGLELTDIIGDVQASPERGTYFNPGYLAIAMRYGLTYIADEYDYADPSIVSQYQAVLEGKPLIIPNAIADIENPENDWRKVVPHPMFRFAATGNTNGAGDETGMFIGTNIGNVANYSRFNIRIRLDYIKSADEQRILTNKSKLTKHQAKQLVKVANVIRSGGDNSKGTIQTPISTRELLEVADLGSKIGSAPLAFQYCYSMGLNSVEQETANGIMQRYWSPESAE